MTEDRKDQPVQAALAAEPLAIEDTFRRYHAMVFGAAYRVTGNLTDAEDVLQTVFLRLLRRDREAEAVDRIENYLRRAAVNAAVDVVRSRQQGRKVPLADVEPHLAQDPSRSPESRHSDTERRDWLRNAVARLSPRTAEIFALRYFEGYDNSEIARMFETTPSVIAVTLHRTRERLEKEFGRFAVGAGFKPAQGGQP